MATLEDSVVSSINTNYGGTGGGGTKPANIVNLNAYIGLDPFNRNVEWIVVWEDREAEREPVTPLYANIKHKVKVWISTSTGDDRLKQISDEVISVINNNAITGINAQWISKEKDISDRSTPIYMMELTCFFLQLLVQSEVAFSASADPHNHDDRYYTETEVEAMIGGISFKTITGITNDVVAETVEDTLTLASANNRLTIVGTSATDTITFTLDETAIDHDNLTNTHNLTTDLDTEIETIITAELVDGQSIDNAIDSLISTHTGIAAAHHTKYTDLEAVAAAQAANPLNLANKLRIGTMANAVIDTDKFLVKDDSASAEIKFRTGAEVYSDIGVASGISTAIATHAGIASAHHAKTTSIADLTDHNKANHDALALSHDSLSDVSTSDHHARYADGEAVTAMGAKADANPLNHDRYADAEALAQAATLISDAAYAAGWDADTTHTASKNALYDILSTLGGASSLAAVVAVGNETDGTNILLDSGADLIVYSDDKITEKARIDGATGNITTAGTVDGIDISANIDQAVKTTSSPTFQDVYPRADNAYDLGTAALNWRDLYVSNVKDPAGNTMLSSDGTGKWDCNIAFAGAQTVDGVDISAHAANATAHQDAPALIATHTAIAAAHHNAPDNTAFGTSWNAVTTIAPSKNAVYDIIRQHLDAPSCGQWLPVNGASFSGNYGAYISLPNADSDAAFHWVIRVPDTWITGIGTYLKVAYVMGTANQAYSGIWNIATGKIGETRTYNLLSGSTGYDFALQTVAWKLGINSIDLGSTIEAGDVVGGYFISDASNGTELNIHGMWLSW